MYPTKKQEMAALSSGCFEARLLAVLLQFTCHLSPPYPHGWSALPLPQDLSLSADVVRLQMYFQQVSTCTCTISRSFYVKMYFQQVSACTCTLSRSFYVKMYFQQVVLLEDVLPAGQHVHMYSQQVILRKDVLPGGQFVQMYYLQVVLC